MADELRIALAEVLRKAGVEQADFLREGARVLTEEFIEMEITEHVDAERHDRRELTWCGHAGLLSQSLEKPAACPHGRTGR